MRGVLMLTILLAHDVANVNATNIWLSPSNASSAPPSNASDIPYLADSGVVYVWARPDPNKTLFNWSMNIHTSSPGVINFVSAKILDPLLGVLPRPGPDRETRRWEYIAQPAPKAGGQAIDLFQAFSLTGTVVAAGIGPHTANGIDPYYDPVNDSWLIAEITYAAAGSGFTDLFLQIGVNGLNNVGESSAGTDVVFGAPTDPPLNGLTGRNMDSATPEARIVVPEPSTVLLGTIGLVELAFYVVGATRTSCSPGAPVVHEKARAGEHSSHAGHITT